ncbi:MAG: hypothetical protein AB8I80_11440, partial [Anaerolineae bacterium]
MFKHVVFRTGTRVAALVLILSILVACGSVSGSGTVGQVAANVAPPVASAAPSGSFATVIRQVSQEVKPAVV